MCTRIKSVHSKRHALLNDDAAISLSKATGFREERREREREREEDESLRHRAVMSLE